MLIILIILGLPPRARSGRRLAPLTKIAFLVGVSLSDAARAELQQARAGGSIEIYAAYYSNFFADVNRVVWPGFLLPGRAIGPTGTATYVDNDGDGNNIGFIEQRTKINLTADFTDRLRGFIELDSVWNWGDDSRSDPWTGVDLTARPNAGDPELFQAYVEMSDVFDAPVRLRVGRQTLAFGDEWLVGTNADPDPFIEVSFDAIRFTLERRSLNLDLWAALLAESGVQEEDGDTLFSGLYNQWRITEAVQLDFYYLLVRDASSVNDTNLVAPLECFENILELDDYGPTVLHTAGLRIAGMAGRFDFTAETSYQWGDAAHLGSAFRPFNLYGDDDARYDAWAGAFEVGYTFDAICQPRLFAGGAYFGAGDRRGVSFPDWANPFRKPEASVSFNRLFSSYRPTHFLDYSALSNFWLVRLGIEIQATERLAVRLDTMYHEIVEPFDPPVSVTVGPFRVPLAPALSFWTDEGRDDLGVEIMLAPTYSYSDDLTLSMQFVYYLVGSAFEDGVFFDENGTRFIGGSGDKDAISATFLATLRF